MILLRNKTTGEAIGEITEEDLAFLQDQMVEESEDDRDYYINEDELEVFTERGASPEMIALLRGALDDNGELEIEWDDEG